jgi:hypothetical protein
MTVHTPIAPRQRPNTEWGTSGISAAFARQHGLIAHIFRP